MLHCCVPNLTAVVARTATHAFNNAMWPFMWEVARAGLDDAMARLPALRRGIATHDGHVVSMTLAAHLGMGTVTP
jgi:alanine dehydrogenase